LYEKYSGGGGREKARHIHASLHNPEEERKLSLALAEAEGKLICQNIIAILSLVLQWIKNVLRSKGPDCVSHLSPP
jgi:hypothetical protein